ncbi:hypothetical protein ACVWZR_002169 [Bradyrhizobium sp. i1.3.1]
MIVGEFDGGRNPLPAFGCNRLGFGFELFCHETIQQSDVQEPAAVIVLEQIPQNAATSLLVSIQPNELNAAIGRAHGILREHSPDLIGFIIAGSADALPDLLLPGVVGANREGHELLECHAVFGVDVVELWRHGGKPKSLLHDGRCHEVPGSDILLGQAGATQGLEGSKLIERMKPYPLIIFRKRVVFSDAPLAHDTGNGLCLGHAPLLDEKFQRAVAPASGRHLEHAGLIAFGVHNRPHVETLQERTLRDTFGELLDGNARLHTPDVGLAEDQLVERDVT